MYQIYLALCRRSHKAPVITEQIVVGIYLRYLPEDLGTEVRDLASDDDLESLYTAAKFAAASEDRRTTHPPLRDARGSSGANGDVATLFTITWDLTGNRYPVFADGEQRASALTTPAGAIRPSRVPHEEGPRQQGADRRQEGFQERPACPTMQSSLVPPRAYLPRSRYGFEDVPSRDRGHPGPLDRVFDRRYSADPRPARWPQVHMTNVRPPLPGAEKPAGPHFHSMTPRRVPEFQPASVAPAGWNPCFACGQVGHRLISAPSSCAQHTLKAYHKSPLYPKRNIALIEGIDG